MVLTSLVVAGATATLATQLMSKACNSVYDILAIDERASIREAQLVVTNATAARAAADVAECLEAASMPSRALLQEGNNNNSS